MPQERKYKKKDAAIVRKPTEENNATSSFDKTVEPPYKDPAELCGLRPSHWLVAFSIIFTLCCTTLPDMYVKSQIETAAKYMQSTPMDEWKDNECVSFSKTGKVVYAEIVNASYLISKAGDGSILLKGRKQDVMVSPTGSVKFMK